MTDVESNIAEPVIDNGNFRVLGAVQEKERLDIDCAVKEYLMAAGYKISAMTFQEEVPKDTLALCCGLMTGECIILCLHASWCPMKPLWIVISYSDEALLKSKLCFAALVAESVFTGSVED